MWTKNKILDILNDKRKYASIIIEKIREQCNLIMQGHD